MATVGVVTVAVGERYQAFLPEWAASVAALNRSADAVRVVVDQIDPLVWAEVSEILPSARAVYSTREWEHHPQVLANDGIATLNTDWICKLDVDDLLLPHAFDKIDGIEADVYAFGILLDDGRGCRPYNLETHVVRDSSHNQLYAASPFRRSVWERSHGFVDAVFDDWIFWREAAANGARFEPSGTIDYRYRQHEFNASRLCDEDAERLRVFEARS